MRPTALLAFAIATALALTACGEADESSAGPNRGDRREQVTAFIDINLIPMTDERVVENQTVLVEGTRIIEVGPPSELAVPENANVIDGAGAYLMPGLADMHMHTKDDWDDWPVTPLSLFLTNGVTVVRDLGPNAGPGSSVAEALQFALRLRDEIKAGEVSGPTLYTSGLRPGHEDALGQDPRGIVQEDHAQGFDFLKIYSYLSKEEFQEAMAAAKELDMYTTGHIPFTVGLEGVLAAGMDEIAHIEELDWEFIQYDRDKDLPWDEWFAYIIGAAVQQVDFSAGFDVEDFKRDYGETLSAIARSLKSANVTVCTTLIVSDLIVQKVFQPEAFLARPELKYLPQYYLDSFMQGKEKHQMLFQGIKGLGAFKYELDKMLLRELHRAGVPLLLGTDTGSATMGIVPGFSIHDELRILTENGFTPYEAIATGTVNAARVVEKMTGEADFGTIEAGKRADLILVNANPLEDIANIKELLGVMAAGRWYSKETLEQVIAVEQ